MKKWLSEYCLVIFVTLLISTCIVGVALIMNQPAVTKGFPNTIQRVLPSTVHIMADRWQGSGVAITKDIIVTARHVIDGSNYTITLNNGCQVKGVQAVSHKDYDIGFIKIDNECISLQCEKHKHLKRWAVHSKHTIKMVPAKFGSIEDCVLGQAVFIIGSPFGRINFNNVTLGIISGLNKNWEGLSRYGEPYGWEVAFTSDSGAHPGNSGGPIYSMDGVVRGLLVGGFSPVLNCSMPSDLFMDDINEIKLMFAMNKYTISDGDNDAPSGEWGQPIEIEPCMKDYNYAD
jgi:S1-C subfamily serine protease